MMTKRCPNCNTLDTEMVHRERYTYEIRETRYCRECSAEWDLVFENPHVEHVEVYDE